MMSSLRNLFVLILLSIAFAGGCASTGEKAVESFATTRKMVDDADGQVDKTMGSLVALRGAPASYIKDAFGKYKENVMLLDEEGKKMKIRAAAMKDESDAHVKAWEKEMESISDPQIKSILESRREAVRANYQYVRMYADDARKAYEPFLKGNQQLVQALSIDLSPAGVSSLAPSMDKVLADGQTLKQKIQALQRALMNIGNGVSPLVAP
jgi:hypothetical protein